MSAKEYKIITVQDFLFVPQNKIKKCLEEFEVAIKSARLVKIIQDEISPDASFKWPSFTWIDDDKYNIKIKLTNEKKQ